MYLLVQMRWMQPDRAQKIGLAAQHPRQAFILLIQGIVIVTRASMPPGLSTSRDFARKVMQGEAIPAYTSLRSANGTCR